MTKSHLRLVDKSFDPVCEEQEKIIRNEMLNIQVDAIQKALQVHSAIRADGISINERAKLQIQLKSFVAISNEVSLIINHIDAGTFDSYIKFRG